jgi:hypothetical protein
MLQKDTYKRGLATQNLGVRGFRIYQRFREILEILRDSTRFLRDSESSFPQNSARGATSPLPSFCTEVCTMLRSGRSSVLACSIQLIDM